MTITVCNTDRYTCPACHFLPCKFSFTFMKCHFPNVRASSLWLNGYWYENWAHLHMDAHTHMHTYIPHLHVNHYLLWGSSYLKVENECPHQSEGQFGVTVHKRLILYVHQLDLGKSEHAIVRSANPSAQKPSDQSCSHVFVTVQLLTLCKHGDGRSGRSCHMLGDAM